MVRVAVLAPVMRRWSRAERRQSSARSPMPTAADTPGESRDVQADGLATSRRILVVDDHRDSADSLAIALRLLGYQVWTAHDGPSALAVADEWQPNIGILDIGMPGMDGYQLARRLRATPWGRDILLIALTGWAGEEYQRLSRGAGFDHYFPKPVLLESLLEAIRSVAG